MTDAELAAHLPARHEYGRWVDRFGLGKATAAFAVVSGAVVALFLTAPGWLRFARRGRRS